MQGSPWAHMFKFGLLVRLKSAVGFKNSRAGTVGIGKNRIHNPSCTALGLAVVCQPMKKHNSLSVLGLMAPLALAATLITGCAETVNTRGQVILPSRLAQIQPGTSTRQDVLQLLGSPSSQGTLNDDRWYYVTSTVGSTSLNPYNLKSRQVVIIDFTPDTDTVATLTQKTEADGKEVDPSDTTTQTHGQSLGVVEQFFGNFGNIFGK
ncbi:MAG: outer membrane protein assembly factor BamE [Alphaproteobacteria bacterium]|nr:MAG: outer membrane protein assembly factor BamE [Alphaproteobacteria bacterium]